MGIILITVMMLVASNIFMTFAWYGHLKDLKDRPWPVAALISWGIATLPVRLRPICRGLHEAIAPMGLSLSSTLFVRGSVLHLSRRFSDTGEFN